MAGHGFTLSMIAAMTRNRTIGKDGKLPWKCPEDMAYFRGLTVGKICLAGRRTYMSLPKDPATGRHGLPGRLVVPVSRRIHSRDPENSAPDLDHALNHTVPGLLPEGWHTEVMVIGGAALYSSALELVDRIYLTTIHGIAIPEGDAHFPGLLAAEWATMSLWNLPSTQGWDLEFRVLQRDGSPGTGVPSPYMSK